MSRTSQLMLMDVATERPSRAPAPAGQHGEVFTRRWVVELLLDLAGYRAEEDLGASVVVEPSCGCGAFIIPIVERLADSCARHGRRLSDLGHAIRAFDLLEPNVEHTRKAVIDKLLELGEPLDVAERLSGQWVVTDDFLLADHRGLEADFVVGNPPYIRLEDVPDEISDAYRSALTTMRGRADIFVGFFERGLSLLAPDGRLAFICADRWMRNQYGAHLRSFVAPRYAVDGVLVLHDVDAFEDPVAAYPAITVIRNGPQGPAKVADTTAAFGPSDAGSIANWFTNAHLPVPVSSAAFEAAELPAWFSGGAHWPAGSPHDLELIAHLEARFAPLEDPGTGTRVGIGVATGCDDVFITTHADDVEPSRLLPLLTASDIAGGEAEWGGRYLVNPWEQGRLVELSDFPGLTRYLEAHGERIRGRHVAKRQPARWYRTIDKIDPALQARPKLLLPDMKAAAHPVLDPGAHYPHHNLYFVVSDEWDLEVLGGLLLSDVANLFVGAYCVKMRGGTYRFQAQYLRKIRVPGPNDLSEDAKNDLRAAFRARDRAAASAVVWPLYGVDPTPPTSHR
ncbi:MAG: Eco57I restriction-modification methylase domain-containing protein [Acidimicrobiales bacterium]